MRVCERVCVHACACASVGVRAYFCVCMRVCGWLGVGGSVWVSVGVYACAHVCVCVHMRVG